MADAHDNNGASPDDATGADHNKGISQRGKIEFRCTCGMVFRVDAALAGKKGRCKTCGASLLISGGRVDVADVAQEGVSSETTTPPDADIEESTPLMDASAAETGWLIDKDGPFPEIDDYKITEP